MGLSGIDRSSGFRTASTVDCEGDVTLISRVYEPRARLSSLALTILGCQCYVDEPLAGAADRPLRGVALIARGPALTARLG
jgi:hypothetical protein